MKWISVDERLPEKYGTYNESTYVIVSCKDYRVWLAYYDYENEVWSNSRGWDENVTHWMPLPPPPEAQS